MIIGSKKPVAIVFSLRTFLSPHQADAPMIKDVDSSVVKIVAHVNEKTKVGCEIPLEQHLFGP